MVPSFPPENAQSPSTTSCVTAPACRKATAPAPLLETEIKLPAPEEDDDDEAPLLLLLLRLLLLVLLVLLVIAEPGVAAAAVQPVRNDEHVRVFHARTDPSALPLSTMPAPGPHATQFTDLDNDAVASEKLPWP